MNAHWCRLGIPVLYCTVAARLWAGGSGLNVVVVVNQNSTNSVQLGNHYCEKRQVPPQNLLRTSWSGGNIDWQKSDFQSVILSPLLSMLSARLLTRQIDYVLLSMDFPYRVTDTTGANSTTAALFYGFVPDDPAPGPGLPATCSLPSVSSNSYAGSEGMFRAMRPGNSRTNFLAVMLTASNLMPAKVVVDRGIAGDGTFPTQTVYVAKSSDVYRNIRYSLSDNAVFNARVCGNYSMQLTNADPGYSFGTILGLQSGWGSPDVIWNTSFVPGALADNFTSWGGTIFESSGQFNILALLDFGVAGCYGTVVEPCGYLAKFPSPQNYFYQERGFSMAECYYQSVTNPYQGLLLGDPLAAPFAVAPTCAWNNLPVNALLSGTTNLSFQAEAADKRHPIQQVDLFVDGTYVRTLTNIPPSQSNSLFVTIRGQSVTYSVPANATIRSVTADLAAFLNIRTSATLASAIAHGDRIELQSLDLTRPGAQVPISVGSAIGTASSLSTFVTASRTNFLDTAAFGTRAFIVARTPSTDSYLLLKVTSTNGTMITVGATNSPGNTSITALAQMMVNLINATPALSGSDGLIAEDLLNFDSNSTPFAQFNLRARSAGWNAAQLQVRLSVSSSLLVQPSGPQKLDQNLLDLQPRNHLYITVGVTNLLLSSAFDTTTLADGFHELTAVAYEGSHVRTQKRAAQTVRIQNGSLAAAFTTLLGDTNTALEATLQFSVVANTNGISKIELFSTGGPLESVLNQSN
ncbi:MAG: TIGR03790 family protein, partial [Verrucomicrobia bacterium]|nr:TIGR03790 family protein [Verrucomicrobiota bacterium]